MKTDVVPLRPEHVRQIITVMGEPRGITVEQMIEAYFSSGSVSYCATIDGVPALAAGIMNLGWRRGEAWVLHSALFHRHVKTLFRIVRDRLPILAAQHHFRRVQAGCFGISNTLVEHLGFEAEGILKSFGPNREDATMYARIFE